MYQDDVITRVPPSQVRYRAGEIPGQDDEAQAVIDTMSQTGTYRPRASQQRQGSTTTRIPRNTTAYQQPAPRRRADEAASDTDAWSNQTTRAPRPRRSTTTTTQRTYSAPASKLKKQPHSTRQKQPKHPAVYIGATAAAIVGFVILSTSGAAWWSTHLSDPGTYGPTHGTIATTVLGGGDSKEHPTKIIGLNNGGKVELIIMHANDPAKMQVISGPDLTTLDFPDPTNAEVDVQTGDYNHDGKQDVKVMIYATSFDFPFHRYNRPSILDGDGKGGLKLQQPKGGQ